MPQSIETVDPVNTMDSVSVTMSQLGVDTVAVILARPISELSH
jgi:hypothetical protein